MAFSEGHLGPVERMVDVVYHVPRVEPHFLYLYPHNHQDL